MATRVNLPLYNVLFKCLLNISKSYSIFFVYADLFAESSDSDEDLLFHPTVSGATPIVVQDQVAVQKPLSHNYQPIPPSPAAVVHNTGNGK
jgi:hypothetical protein